ncbi:chromosomal replication initiator protein DnaA, partial [Streptococcus suis]
MKQEQLFWQRFIELEKVYFKQSIYDFYVADAKLLGINQQVDNIFLNRPFKKDFCEKNFEELIISASFEI